MTSGLPDYYEANLALLKKHHPSVWQKLMAWQPTPTGTISQAQNGSPTLTVTDMQGKAIALHNSENPATEANYFLEKIGKNHTGFVALLGMGLGYAAMALLEERPLLQFLAVFELEPGIFQQALRYMDLSSFLADQRLILNIGAVDNLVQTLEPASRTIQLETSNIFYHRQSHLFNKSGYEQLKDEIFSHVNALNIGGTTTRALGWDFMANRFAHICTIHHHLLLEHLQNAFTGVPAILVAGGPSLDKNIDILPQAQEKAVIIAVDTVLPALLNHGVHPHFLTSIDPKNLTYEKFADVAPRTKDVSLICPTWVNPRTPKVFPAEQIFWTFTSRPVESWINSLLGGKLLTGGASTVAHLNLIAAHILGCDPIIFLGQDLAFPSTTSHVNGTVLHRQNPQQDPMRQGEGQTVKGIDGSMLRTDRSFLSMKKHFEAVIEATNNRYINATEGGAHIEGTEVLTLQKTIDTCCEEQQSTTQKIKDFATRTLPTNPRRMLAEFEKSAKEVQSLKKVLDQTDEAYRSAIKKIEKLGEKGRPIQSFKMLPPQLQQKIREIDGLNKKLDSALTIWKLLEEITMEGLKESERQRQAISVLADTQGKYIEWLKKNFERFLEISKVRKETLTLFEDNLNMVLSFHAQEESCRTQIAEGKEEEEALLSLVRLYNDSGNYSLAKPLAEKLQTLRPGSGEVHFHLGCIDALRTEFDKAEKYFAKARETEPDLDERIEQFRRQLGDEFLTFAEYFKTQPGRKPSTKYTLRKGLRYAPAHDQLLAELEALLGEDLEQIVGELNKGNRQEAEKLCNEWQTCMAENKTMAANLNPKLAGQLCQLDGQLHSANEDLPKALASFRQGLEFDLQNADLHILLVDTLFAIGEFNEGIAALNKAVEIDRQCASYWENIGDSLHAAGQHEDAIVAYERCYLHLPEKINLLKKIGDSYQAGNQLEAAREAYQLLKEKLQEAASPTDEIQ